MGELNLWTTVAEHCPMGLHIPKGVAAIYETINAET